MCKTTENATGFPLFFGIREHSGTIIHSAFLVFCLGVCLYQDILSTKRKLDAKSLYNTLHLGEDKRKK